MSIPVEVSAAAERGWRVFPCVPGEKRPMLKSWQMLATSHLPAILRWATRHPRCNWAVATGAASGVFVVDVDDEPGYATLAELERAYYPLPATLRALTARGEHRWLRYPSQVSIRNTVGTLGTGIDTKGEGGYVLIPPSVHPTGPAYRWADFGQAIAPAPEWLLRLLTKTAHVAQSDTHREILNEGSRNNGLTRLAGALRRRGASESEIERALTEANHRCNPPLPPQELKSIARSVATYAAGSPDVLQAAVEAIEGEAYRSHTDRFYALCDALQRLRGDEPVILPVERIAAAFGCHWSLIARLRREAVAAGWLIPERKAIAHRQAARFRVLSDTHEKRMSHENENETTNETKVKEQSLSDTPTLSETHRCSETHSLSETSAFGETAANLAAMQLDETIFSNGRPN